jgi:hypothetical protein
VSPHNKQPKSWGAKHFPNATLQQQRSISANSSLEKGVKQYKRNLGINILHVKVGGYSYQNRKPDFVVIGFIFTL